MRHFSHEEFKALAKRHIFRDQLITVVSTHSDNASQHFRSAKTMNWYSSLIDPTSAKRFVDNHTAPPPSKEGAGLLHHLSNGKIVALIYDTGAPGHGKGYVCYPDQPVQCAVIASY